MGRNLVQVRDNILKKVVASTRKNSKAQTLTDKKINVSIFFFDTFKSYNSKNFLFYL